jgi:hypothetical protein
MNQQHAPTVEPLESRILMSESASAVLNLVSTAGTNAAPVYNYDITLKNTGTTPVGTFWFSWVPGEDFLATVPISESSPAGWGNAAGTSSTPAVTGSGNSTDGSAIQWVAQSPSAVVMPGQSLDGFVFSSDDSPAVLSGQSPSHPSEPVLTAFVYQGAPFSDAGFQFSVTNNASSSTSTTTTTTTTPTTSASVTPTIAKSTLPPAIVAGSSGKGIETVSLANTSGSAFSGSVTVGIYATTDGTVDGSAVLLASASHHLKLATGKAAAVSVPIKSTPATLAAGSYTLVAKVTDSSGNSSDSAAGPAVTVAAPLVTLSESFARLSLPATVATGSGTHGSATLTIDNTGNIATSGSTTVEFFLSATGTTSDATPIETSSKSLRILPGKTKTLTFPLSMIPQVTVGPYFVVAEVTDSEQGISTVVSSAAVNVVAATAAVAKTGNSSGGGMSMGNPY